MKFMNDRVGTPIAKGAAKVYNLPTGNDLMNTPIVDPALSRKDREVLFVIENVESRLNEIVPDKYYQLKKGILFTFGVLLAVIGMIIIFYGMGYTVLFIRNRFSRKKREGIYIIGGFFCCPLLGWFVYIFLLPLCSTPVRNYRAAILQKRRERKKPSLFNEMVKEAEDFTKPPVKYMKVVALFKKKEIILHVSTLEDFMKKFSEETGLAPHRQRIKYRGDEIYIPELRLDDDYGIGPMETLHVFNKGGFLTPQINPDGFTKPDLEHGLIEPKIIVEEKRKRSIEAAALQSNPSREANRKSSKVDLDKRMSSAEAIKRISASKINSKSDDSTFDEEKSVELSTVKSLTSIKTRESHLN